METKRRDHNITLLSTKYNTFSSFSYYFLKFSLMAILLVALLCLVLLSGVSMGNSGLNKTLYVDDANIGEMQDMLIDIDDLSAAKAAGGTTQVFTFASADTTTINKTNSVSIGGYTMTSSHVSYVSYWAGNSSSTKYYASSNGKFGVYGSGTVRQKRITMNAYVNFGLGPNLQALAAANKLTVTVSGTYGTGNGYDQDIYAGYKFTTGAVNATENSGDTRLKDFPNKVTTFRKSSGSNSFSFSAKAVPTTAKNLVLGVCGTCTYSGIGGRLPDVYMQAQTVTFTSTDTAKPTIMLPYNYYTASYNWQTSRKVAFKAYDDVATNKLVSVNAKTGSTSLYSASNTTNNSNDRITTASAFASGFTADALDMSGNTQTSTTYYSNATGSTTTAATVPLAALKIDVDAPTISDVKFVRTTDRATLVNAPYNGTVTLLVTVTDTQSGVGKGTNSDPNANVWHVIVNNPDGGINNVNATLHQTITSNSNPTSTSSAVFRLDLEYKANGNYTITVRDNARNADNVLSDSTRNAKAYSGYSFSHQDNTAPTIAAPTLQFLKRSSDVTGTSPTTTNTTYTSSIYANNYVTMTFTVTDTTGSNFSTANNNTAVLNGIKVLYYLNGTLMTITPTLQSGYPSFSNPTRTYVYKCDLPYNMPDATSYNINPATGATGSGVSCTYYTIWTIDKAGNYKVYSGIQVKIDTIAPLISTRTISSSDGAGNTAGKGSVAYANKNLTLTVVCTDIKDSNNINNGSGIKAIYIYNTLTGAAVTSVTTLNATTVTQSFTLSSNSITNWYHYRIIVIDHAGNSSQWGVGNALGITNYYDNKTIETTKTFYTMKDAVVPSIAFQYSTNGGASYTSTALGANDTFTYPWTKDATVYFRFIVTFGSSGGSFRDNSNEVELDKLAQAITVSGSTYTINATTNKDNNTLTITVPKSAEGTQSYRYKFTNGANVTIYSPTVVTRIDRTAPTISLMGFGDYLTDGTGINTKNDIVGKIVNLKTEDQLTNASAWISTANTTDSIYAIFYIEDTGSGIGTTGISNSTGTQSALTKVNVTFSHNGYQYSWVVYPTKVGNVSLVQVRFWHPTEMNNALKGASSFVIDANEGKYDILSGSKLRYNVVLTDFIGNTSNAYMKGNSINMEYCVDPFIIAGELLSVVKVSSSGVTTPYNCIDWTKEKVVITIKKTVSLTPTYTDYGFFEITDMPDGTVSGRGNMNNYTSWQSIPTDNGTATTVTLELNAISRCQQIFFRIRNSCATPVLLFGGAGYGYIDVRQDTSAPILKAVAFSTNPALTIEQLNKNNADIAIFYEYNKDTGVWTRTSSNTANNVWSTGSFVKKTIASGKITYSEERTYLGGLYMYIRATDTQGTGGMGSGIASIKITLDGIVQETLTLMTTSIASTRQYNVLGGGTNPNYTGQVANTHYYIPSTGEGMYCSGKVYGYLTANELKSLDFYLLDNQGNNVNVSVTTDKDNKKILPVIDNTMPNVSLLSANYGGVSYLSGGMFSGQPIKQDLNIMFKVNSGVSGAKLYWRLREYDVPLSGSDGFKVYNTTDVPFGLIGQTSGVSTWTEMYTYSTPNTNASIPYNIDKSNSVKNRFEVLLVTTTGAFYYLDCGNVFIDITPPVIDASKTFFTRSSDAQNNLSVVDHESITKVNDVVGGSKYTNDSIYAYFYIYDAASGVNTVYYDDQGVQVPLETVTVSRIVSGQRVEATYYRMLITVRNVYVVKAVDNSGNEAVSSQFQPNIDKTAVDVLMSATKADGSNYILGTGNVFTNSSKVQVTITVNYGASGFGGVAYSIDGGAYSPISTGKLFNVDWVKTAGLNQHKIIVDFTEEQNSVYSFRAYNNVTNDYAVGGSRPMGSNTMKIAIDKTKPSIDLSKGNYNLITTVWHGSGQVLSVSVGDKNALGLEGSGIASVRLDYSIQGQAQDAIAMALSDGLYTTGATVLGYYVDYVITMTDKAGNVATQLIRPRLDTKDPIWGTYTGGNSNYKLLTAPSSGAGVEYVADTWSKEDIKSLVTMIYSMSGVTLQYYRSNTAVSNPSAIASANWTNLSGGSAAWSTTTPAIADAGKTMTRADVEYLISILAEQNISQYHYLRMVSGAGRASSVLSLGCVKIDKETPKISIKSRINNNNTDFGSIDTVNSITTFATWTASDLTMNVSSGSTLVSGYTVHYRLSPTAPWNHVEYNYSGSAVTYVYGVTANIPDAKKMSLLHRVSESTNKATYQYYISSGSGMESPIYTISEIKIDTATPNLTVAGKTSNIFGTENGALLRTATVSEYNAASGSYTIANPSWVNTNSVIVAITVRDISYSGVSLYINNNLYDTFSYGQSDITKYYVVSSSMSLSIRLLSGADKDRRQEGNVKIDNDIPIIYVSGQVLGTKASNFNEVTENADKWYTSKITINLVAGRYVNNGGVYTYQEDTANSGDEIPSGYTIYYSINGGAWISNDQVLSVNANNIDASGNFIDPINNTYRFKIVSGSGMSYELGGVAVSNTGSTAKTVAEIRSLIDSKNGLIKNLNNNDYHYTVNVDSRDFMVIGSHIMALTLNNGNSYNWTESAGDNPVFSKDTIYKSSNGTASGTFTLTTAPIFKRGDYLRVEYSTSAYSYIFRYADYGNFDGSNWTNRVDNDSGSNTEVSGYFEYGFVNTNLSYNSYFMKELTAEYANLKLYLQSAASATVSASASFIYKNAGGANEVLSLKFDYQYKDMTGTAANKDNLPVGGYVVSAVISGNNINSFRLTNPSAVLLVKYFTEQVTNGTEIANSKIYPYTVYNENDLTKISTNYYDGYTESNGVFTLNAPKSYLNCHYILNDDILLTNGFNGIAGTFNGSLEGGGNTLTLWGGSVNMHYGLFHKLSGEVTNLSVGLGQTLAVSQAIAVGILAREIDSGVVTNVYVKGSIAILSASLEGKVGGIAGQISNATLGANGKPIYTDVSITNNGNSIEKAYIGGIAGYIEEGSKLNYTYTYGDITLYNVEAETEAGLVFGKIAPYVTAENRNTYFFNNYYLEKAAFINGTAVNGFSSSNSLVNDGSESYNTVRSRSYAAFVGVNTASGEVGATFVNNNVVRELVLSKLYKDMNLPYLYEIDGVTVCDFNSGEGTFDSNLVVGNMAQFVLLDKYNTLHYSLSEDLDFGSYQSPIAQYRIFYGVLEGNKHTIYNFGGNVQEITANNYGMIANLDGTVKGFIFDTIDMNVVFNDSGKLAFGLIAGTMGNNAKVGDIIALGSIAVAAKTSSVVNMGGIVGEITGGNIYDVFVMNNLRAEGDRVNIGGIAGIASGAKLAVYHNGITNTTGAIFSLGRVESMFVTSSSAGFVIGTDVGSYGEYSSIFAISNNAYSNGAEVNQAVGNGSSAGMNVVSFTNPDEIMRKTLFSDNTNVFDRVFGYGEDRLYPLAGFGTTTEKFIVKSNAGDNSINDFKYINQALFAYYNIEGDITFATGEFQTIGKGLVFTGSIDGKNAESSSAEEGSVSSLLNVTDALVDMNRGEISDLVINVSYTGTANHAEDRDYDLVFGAVANYNENRIRNVTVSGEIYISATSTATVVVSGFVGIDKGGVIEGDSKIQNSISGLNIQVVGGSTVYGGGFVGIADGQTTLSYGIGSGTLAIDNATKAWAGTLIGRANDTVDVSSLEEHEEYQYIVTVNGIVITKVIGSD